MKKSMVVVCNTLVSLALALGSISLLQGCGEQPTDAQYVERAREAKAKGEVRSSIINLKSALQQNPANTEARALLGQVYVEIGDGPAAEKELRQALDRGMPIESLAAPFAKSLLLQGKYVELLNMQVDVAQLNAEAKADYQALGGRAYLAQDRLAEAANLFDSALAAKPDAPMALLGKALLAVRRGEWDDARRWNEQALSAAPKFAEAWNLQGVLEQRAVNLDKAQQAFAQAVANSPFNNGQHRLQRALVCVELKDYQCAEQEAQALHKISPTYPGSSYVQGRVYFDQKRFPEAQTAFEQELKNNQNNIYTLYFLALTHLAQAHRLQAEEYLKQLTTLAPEAEQAPKLLAQLYLQNKDFSNASALLQGILRRSPNDPEAVGMAGFLRLAQGDVSQGIDYIRKAADLTPEDAPARVRLGLALLGKGESDEGIQELQNAIKLDPNLQRADMALILGYLKAQAYDKALEAANTLVAKQPTDPASQNLLGLVYQQQGKIPQARSAFEQALKLQSTFSVAEINLARLDVQAGDWAAAEARYRRVLQQDAANLGALLGLAEAARQAGQSEQVISWLSKAWDSHPEFPQAGLALAQAYLDNHDKAQALQVAQRLRDAYPQDAQAQRGLGIVQLANDQLADAKTSFRRLTELQPQMAESWYLLAVAQRQAGDPKAAIASFDKALTTQGDYLPALIGKTELLRQTRRFDEALVGARAIQAKRPDQAVGYRLEGNILLQQQNFTKAIAAYRKAHDKAADSESLLLLSNAHLQAGDAKAALQLQREWLDGHPQDRQVRTQLARTLQQIGRTEEATAEYERLTRGEPSAANPTPEPPSGVTQADVLLNQTYLQQKEYDKAIAAASELIKKLPNNPAPYNLLGAVYMAKGDAKQARQAFEQMLKYDPNSTTARLNLAELNLQGGDKVAAESLYRQILERDRGNLTALIKLADLASQADRFDEDVVRWLEQAIETNPQAMEPRLRLGSYYARTGKPAQAWAIFQKAQELNPNDIRVWVALGNAQLTAGQPADAVATFRKVVTAQSTAQTHYLLAGAYGALNDNKKAREELEKALKLDPKHVLSKVALIRQAAQENKPEEATSLWQELNQAYPQNPDVIALGGELALRRNRPQEAEEAFKAALDLAPNNQLIINLAQAQWQAGKKEDSIATLESWLKQNPDDVLVHRRLGILYMNLSRSDQAKAAFTKVIERSPQNVLALNNLAWLLQKENPAKAISYAERALLLAPDSADVKDTLAMILLNQGQTERALDLLKQAVAKAPNDSGMQYHLALALTRSGDKDQARKVLKDLLARQTTFLEKAEAEALLQSLGN